MDSFDDDPELDAIRQRRMAEMRAAQGGGRGGQAAQQQKQQQNEQRKMMLSQILSNKAQQRLNFIAQVKPEKARRVEDMLIRMAQQGQIQSAVEEPQLVQMLEKISQQEKANAPKIVMNRRRYDEDD
eukprot:TRINITY_DN2526_c0_g1_i2.p2 TRINITY_DN2526_c0_g1~~TRINITY_DN2526_c0_g1_i2.p2  ORF type:complete len:127 (+),score=35.60 TRINITY_DN2526_c0_g1_i2:26-406(+)